MATGARDAGVRDSTEPRLGMEQFARLAACGDHEQVHAGPVRIFTLKSYLPVLDSDCFKLPAVRSEVSSSSFGSKRVCCVAYNIRSAGPNGVNPAARPIPPAVTTSRDAQAAEWPSSGIGGSGLTRSDPARKSERIRPIHVSTQTPRRRCVSNNVLTAPQSFLSAVNRGRPRSRHRSTSNASKNRRLLSAAIAAALSNVSPSVE